MSGDNYNSNKPGEKPTKNESVKKDGEFKTVKETMVIEAIIIYIKNIIIVINSKRGNPIPAIIAIVIILYILNLSCCHTTGDYDNDGPIDRIIMGLEGETYPSTPCWEDWMYYWF